MITKTRRRIIVGGNGKIIGGNTPKKKNTYKAIAVLTRKQHRQKSIKHFVLVPRTILKNPPISSTKTADAKLVTPFEFSVAIGILLLARKATNHSFHEQSFEKGKSAIENERKAADEFAEAWKNKKKLKKEKIEVEAPKRRHTFSREESYRPKLKREDSITYAGSYAYHKRLKRLRQRPINNPIAIEITQFQIVKIARIHQGAATFKRLPSAMDRLTRPVGNMEPLINHLEREGGRLRLIVNETWLNPPLAKVRLPIPTRSPFATALSLLVHGLDTYSPTGPGIPLKRLANILGISTNLGDAHISKRLSCALDLLNESLKDVRFETAGGNLVRFVCYDKRQDDPDHTFIPPKKIRRDAKQDVEQDEKKAAKNDLERLGELLDKKDKNPLTRTELIEMGELHKKIAERRSAVDNAV